MNNKEKFKALVSTEKTNTVEKNRARIKNRAYLRESQAIALKVLDKLDEPGWSQVRLARAMGVSPQQITKIVKGTENLTLETQIKLQDILNIPILASYYENNVSQLDEWNLTFERRIEKIVSHTNQFVGNYQSSKKMRSKRKKYSTMFYPQQAVS